MAQDSRNGHQDGEENQGFAREMGLAEAMAIGLGAMVGAGIFVLSAEAAERAGPASALTYMIAGLIVLPIALSVSELVTAMPQEGGSYHLISRTLGPLAATVVGPANWLGLTFATGFYLIGFAEYLQQWIASPLWLTATVLGLLLIFLNYRGSRLTGTVEKFIVSILLLLLAVFIVYGFFHVDQELHEPFVPEGWGVVIGTMGLIIVSYTGFEKISTVAEEIKEPGRSLPIAIIGSVIIVTILYGAVLFVMTGLLPYEAATEPTAPLAEAAAQFGGRLGRTALVTGALLATVGASNAALLASSRINYAMGRDQVLPSWFSKLHAEYKTPHRSVLVTGVLAIGLALSGQAPVLAEISSALFMISYGMIAVSVVAMRYAAPDWYRPQFRVPLHPWLPLLGGAASLSVILFMDRLSQVAGVGLAVASALWYFAWVKDRTEVEGELQKRLKAKELRPTLKALVQLADERGEQEKQALLVAVGDYQRGAQLVRLAGHLAAGQGAMDILALRVLPVPQAVALRHVEEDLTPAEIDPEGIVRRVLDESVPGNVEGEAVFQVARTVAGGIVGVAERRSAVRMILLGFATPAASRLPRSRIDRDVEQNSPCDVGVFIDRDFRSPRRVLVAVEDNDSARLGLRLGRWLRQNGAELVTGLRVVTPEGEQEQSAQELVHSLMRKEGLLQGEAQAGEVRAEVVSAGSIEEGIIDAADGYDLLIMGAAVNRTLKERVFGSHADEVARRASCSVLFVQSKG